MRQPYLTLTNRIKTLKAENDFRSQLFLLSINFFKNQRQKHTPEEKFFTQKFRCDFDEKSVKLAKTIVGKKFLSVCF